MPWSARQRTYCLPGSLTVKLALGEAPETVPSTLDVREGRLPAAERLDGGVIDRVARHFARSVRYTRVHGSAASVGKPGARHLRFDDPEHVFGLARTFRVDVPLGTPIDALVDALRQTPIVDGAAPNLVTVTPFAVAGPAESPDDWEPWHAVRGAEALAYERGDVGVIVAVVDSGVAPDHPDLAGRLLGGFDTVQLGRTEFAPGIDLLGDCAGIDPNPTDQYVGHGMACAGIIGALGIGMPPGLAGEVEILPMRALGAARFPGKERAVGIGAATDLDMAVKLSVDLGAKVINMSFGTDDGMLDPAAPKPHADVVAYALDRGCILVAASGNNGAETRYWPAAYPGVITFGSCDAGGRPSVFSTRGEHVAACAPGERVFTLGLEGYQYATGTSFAAPFGAATAALLAARARRRSVPLDGRRARDLIVESARPFPGPAVTGCGAGVLDAFAALQRLDEWIDRALPPESEADPRDAKSDTPERQPTDPR
jgi:subtilisin family serine protease